VVRRSTLAALLALATILAGCSAGADRGGSAGSPSPAAAAVVELSGAELRLTEPDGTSRTLAELDPLSDGEFVHAAVRPGDRERTTLVVLMRTDDGTGPRYELRYLVADASGTSELYWFPWRLQVDDRLTGVLDAPPTPVWAPDGSSLAWVEWDEQGTRLRTVAWRDDDGSSNPSDDAAAYRLAEVPAGTQLAGWEVGSDGVPILRGVQGDTVWNIRLKAGREAVALSDAR
jgi:hypothetical protein